MFRYTVVFLLLLIYLHLNKQMKIILTSLFLFLVSFFFVGAEESERIRVAISPLLTRINVAPGESWSGEVEIFNSNDKDLQFVVFVQDFRGGDEGRVEFINKEEIEKSLDEGKDFLLSQWIDINRQMITIPANESKALPVTINIPENAGPGGKYATILAAIKSPEDAFTGTNLIVSPSVGSLILLNVRGDVIEDAFLREFSTRRTLYTDPEVGFNVRLQNIGNTHIQPRGDIKIYNQWDKIVESILINHNTEFGNVLPQSERGWNFQWDGRESFFEMGRYKATLTLVYGEEASQVISKDIYFWIVPLNLILGLLGIVLFLLLIITLVERSGYKNID